MSQLPFSCVNRYVSVYIYLWAVAQIEQLSCSVNINFLPNFRLNHVLKRISREAKKKWKANQLTGMALRRKANAVKMKTVDADEITFDSIKL